MESHLARLHQAGVVHQSVHPRAILIQAGPLTVPLEHRSLMHPSVRFVDFGDSYLLECFVDGGEITKEEAQEDFDVLCDLDRQRLRKWTT